jgi:PAS domain S-box-containing protein
MKNERLTESQLTTAALYLTEQKQAILSSIITASDDAIISKTLQGVITSWNPAAERLFGYLEAEAVGKHISLIIPKERLQEEAYIIGEIEQGNRINHFETIRLSRDGTLIPISLSVSPVIDAQGTVIGASKIARDISDRQKADEKEGILAAIVNTSDDAIISKTLKGIITSWNPAAERLFGHTEKEVIGKHISLIIPVDRHSEEDIIISNVAQGLKVDHFETLRLTKDGRLVPISVTVSPVMDSTGRIIGASKIARDISGQQMAQEEKARLYEQIKLLNDKKDEFIGLASHELKTPLTSIHGYLQILNQRVKDEQSRNFLKKAGQQVKKVNALIADLLDVSKIEAGKLQLNRERFDIHKLVAEVIETLCLNYEQFTIRLQTSARDLFITGDPHRIEQVIINLVSNAVRYSAGSRQIIVRLQMDGKGVAIGVQDYGIGIPAEKLKDIFAKFFRVDNQNPNISGLGIGLYLSQEVVLRHNGRIWAESELGKGSTFWFTLPG